MHKPPIGFKKGIDRISVFKGGQDDNFLFSVGKSSFRYYGIWVGWVSGWLKSLFLKIRLRRLGQFKVIGSMALSQSRSLSNLFAIANKLLFYTLKWMLALFFHINIPTITYSFHILIIHAEMRFQSKSVCLNHVAVPLFRVKHSYYVETHTYQRLH